MIMYDTYDENQRKQMEETFGEDYCKEYFGDWDGEQAEYYDDLMYREWERKCFEGQKRCGKDAHAYRHDIDNIVIMRMRDEGKSMEEIGQCLGCPRSTIRNRLIKLQMR